jgi:hypothetical protein
MQPDATRLNQALANKNKYYIANTLTTLVVGTAVSFVLIRAFVGGSSGW